MLPAYLTACKEAARFPVAAQDFALVAPVSDQEKQSSKSWLQSYIKSAGHNLRSDCDDAGTHMDGLNR